MAEVRRRHLVTVWNPSVAADAIDAHIAVLLEALRWNQEGEGDDDPCVWWGRVRSPNRQQPLKYLDEVLALDAETPEDEKRLRAIGDDVLRHH